VLLLLSSVLLSSLEEGGVKGIHSIEQTAGRGTVPQFEEGKWEHLCFAEVELHIQRCR
jgi:hypothetical protein